MGLQNELASYMAGNMVADTHTYSKPTAHALMVKVTYGIVFHPCMVKVHMNDK